MNLVLDLKTFEKICSGHTDGGPISKLIPAERFRWLTATRSTILQTSKVHPGFTKDASETLQHPPPIVSLERTRAGRWSEKESGGYLLK